MGIFYLFTCIRPLRKYIKFPGATNPVFVLCSRQHMTLITDNEIMGLVLPLHNNMLLHFAISSYTVS